MGVRATALDRGRARNSRYGGREVVSDRVFGHLSRSSPQTRTMCRGSCWGESAPYTGLGSMLSSHRRQSEEDIADILQLKAITHIWTDCVLGRPESFGSDAPN